MSKAKKMSNAKRQHHYVSQGGKIARGGFSRKQFKRLRKTTNKVLGKGF